MSNNNKIAPKNKQSFPFAHIKYMVSHIDHSLPNNPFIRNTSDPIINQQTAIFNTVMEPMGYDEA